MRKKVVKPFQYLIADIEVKSKSTGKILFVRRSDNFISHFLNAFSKTKEKCDLLCKKDNKIVSTVKSYLHECKNCNIPIFLRIIIYNIYCNFTTCIAYIIGKTNAFMLKENLITLIMR